jgi:quinolinate synthase
MAETAKILNPSAEVILPDAGSTCSLVEQTNIRELRRWVDTNHFYSDAQAVHVSYINSSVQHKAISDWIVTSANVEDIVSHLMNEGNRVLFSPDRNMGAYLAYTHSEWFSEDIHLTFGPRFKYWSAVCEVHDKFKEDEIQLAMREWTDGPKILLAHPESPLPVLKMASEMAKTGDGLVGSTSKMLKFVENYPYKYATIYVATEPGLLYNMKKIRPELDIRLAPTYSGCQCTECSYMKKNTVESVTRAISGAGVKIDYINEELRLAALKPIERMLNFKI